ncbi:MAG: WecB/TagA/CpsF family glycosyltransferase [Dehalococcoidia bacterium]|nr:WecB/TagA/CpsF family glycosyltransferase [Dehalococcoidia bacterium]
MAVLRRSPNGPVATGWQDATEPRAGHVQVGPVAVFDGTLEEAASLCVEAMRARSGARIATANLDFLAQARRDPALRSALSSSSLVTADGAPVAWLARLAGGRRARRVTGVDLVEEICRQAAPAGLRVAFYGSTEAIAAAAAAALEARHPGVQVVCRTSPPFRQLRPEELRAGLNDLVRARPELVLVALGCPRQEAFIRDSYRVVPSACWIGVGGTFDFLAGRRRRAPALLRSVGAEWLVRLAQEPRRLWRRYLLHDAPALAVASAWCLRRRRAAPPASSFDDLRSMVLSRQ